MSVTDICPPRVEVRENYPHIKVDHVPGLKITIALIILLTFGMQQ